MVHNSRALCWDGADWSAIVPSHPESYVCNYRHPPTHSIVPSSTDTQAHGVPLSAVLRRHMHAITAMCSEHKCHSLPVRYVGLVVPVLPALQRVDVCIDTGLATGHRTRHGETRGSGATECVSLRCAGVEVCGGRRVTRAAVCVRVEGNRPASELPSSASLREGGGGGWKYRRFAAVSAR